MQDTYGLKTRDLEEARICLEKVLGFSFDLRESSYMGGNYCSKDMSGKESYTLQTNYSELEGWVEEDHQHLGMILRVFCPPNADELRTKLLSQLQEHIEFIKREVTIENSEEDRWAQEYLYVDGKDVLVSERKLPPANWLKKAK